MSTCNRWTVIPDCSRHDSVPCWLFKDLSDPHKKILLSLFYALPTKLTVDELGSTHTVERMAATFGALTGIPTLPSTLYKALMAARKAEAIETIAQRREASGLLKLATEPEVPA